MNENAACFYVAGYLAKRGAFDVSDDDPIHEYPESEFTNLVSRESLSVPPQWLIQFVSCCYIFLIAELSFVDESVGKVLGKVLFNGIVKKLLTTYLEKEKNMQNFHNYFSS